MKNKIQKLILITLTMTGALTQIGCGPWMYDNGSYDGSYSGSDYSNYEQEKLDPTTLSTDPKTEKVSGGLCSDSRTKYLEMSDADIYTLSLNKKIGNCQLVDAYGMGYFCSAYVKVTASTWHSQGWALNPDSRDSTGCVDHIQWGGYTPAMAGPDLAQNAVEQIRDALRNDQDVCGLCNPERSITAEMILDN